MSLQSLSCDDALNRYLDHLTLRGRAPATVRTYATSIGSFLAFLSSRGRDVSALQIDAVQPADVALFLLHATRSGRKPATRAAYLTAITAFFRYLILHGHYPGTVERLPRDVVAAYETRPPDASVRGSRWHRARHGERVAELCPRRRTDD